MEFPEEGEDAAGGHQTGGAALPVSSHESMKSEEFDAGFSKGEGLLNLGMDDMKQPTGQDDQTHNNTPSRGTNTLQAPLVCQFMRETLDSLSENELTRFKSILRDSYGIPWGKLEKAVSDDIVEQIVQKFCVENSAEVMLEILRTMEKNQLATDLEKKLGKVNSRPQDKAERSALRNRLQSILKDKCFLVHQELGDQQLHVIYTELSVVEGQTAGVDCAHEVSTMHLKQIEKKSSSVTMTSVKLPNIFSDHYHAGKPVTKVLTLGIAGVGKSVAVQKFVLDWAEEKNYQNIELVFVLPFRELSLYKEEYSLFDLLLKFYPELEELKLRTELKGAVLFVLDGLDESRLQLDFENKDKLICDTKEKASVAILITSLIVGKLIPSALIWVTTRPAAASKDLCDLFHLVTEIQGFDEGHREEYFKKVIPKKAELIIKHIKSKRSLYIMCHIPVFCRITAWVLGEIDELTEGSTQEMPNTLTEMYTQFSVFQITRMEKYLDEKMRPEEKGQLLVKLGKLAFDQLEKGTLIFYEKDLKECDIDVSTGALKAGLCTQIFKKESAVSGESMFSFVHLSVQEFLAALYIIHTHATQKKNLLIKTYWETIRAWFQNSRSDLFKMAVDKALESESGHLDLCVRFLLGLAPMLEPKIRHPLNVVLPQLAAREESVHNTVEYIKEKISGNISPERIINPFHCLNELGDNSLVEEIDRYMSSADEERNLTPAQCSAVAYLLLLSAEDFEKFDLKKYLRSEEGLHRMLLVVKVSKRVWLNQCHLSEESCKTMASVLQRTPSHLTELDLSHNDLKDSGVQLLSDGLSSPNCKLQSLRLSLCMITHKGCSLLASALKSNPYYLKELNLSYNHPGDSGVRELTDRLNDPNCKLETFRYDHGGEYRIKPGPRRYACELTLDPNTAHRLLSLSEGNRKATRVSEEQPYPDHPERFDILQVLCREGLSGRCYWEAEWSNDGDEVAAAYKSIQRKGGEYNSRFGYNDKSWRLECSGNSYSARHNNKHTAIPAPSSSSSRVGVYLDWPAGTLSFYSVSSDTLTHLHMFHSTFTEPLYPGFYVHGSSVSLCYVT